MNYLKASGSRQWAMSRRKCHPSTTLDGQHRVCKLSGTHVQVADPVLHRHGPQNDASGVSHVEVAKQAIRLGGLRKASEIHPGSKWVVMIMIGCEIEQPSSSGAWINKNAYPQSLSVCPTFGKTQSGLPNSRRRRIQQKSPSIGQPC